MRRSAEHARRRPTRRRLPAHAARRHAGRVGGRPRRVRRQQATEGRPRAGLHRRGDDVTAAVWDDRSRRGAPARCVPWRRGASLRHPQCNSHGHRKASSTYPGSKPKKCSELLRRPNEPHNTENRGPFASRICPTLKRTLHRACSGYRAEYPRVLEFAYSRAPPHVHPRSPGSRPSL